MRPMGARKLQLLCFPIWSRAVTIGVGGWVSPSLAITVVRQWACVRAPSASWCALQGVMCALCEFFARVPIFGLPSSSLRHHWLQKTYDHGYRSPNNVRFYHRYCGYNNDIILILKNYTMDIIVYSVASNYGV